MSDEVTAFLGAFVKHHEKQRLFQFLNGLNDKYHAQRSQIKTFLPKVETGCGMFQ